MGLKRRRLLGLLGSMAWVVCSGCTIRDRTASSFTLTVSAAASLQNVMKTMGEVYQTQTPAVAIAYNFGSSGSLQRQIEQGAPVDVFLSAAPQQMKRLEEKGLLLTNTRKDLLSNQVVLVIPKAVTNITTFRDLTGPQVHKVAVGDPNSVPAGQYSQEVLTTLKLYQSLAEKLVFARDVRQALAYVETRNVDAGLVYATDAKRSDQVRVIAIAPPESHSPIIYPVAVLKESRSPNVAKTFVQFLSSDAAQIIFEKYGFKRIATPF